MLDGRGTAAVWAGAAARTGGGGRRGGGGDGASDMDEGYAWRRRAARFRYFGGAGEGSLAAGEGGPSADEGLGRSRLAGGGEG